MKNEKEIRDEIQALIQVTQDIVDLATKENRDLNQQEKAILDNIQGNGRKQGQIQALNEDLEREIRRTSAFNTRVVEKMNEIENGSQGSGKTFTSRNGKKNIILNKGDSYAKAVGASSSREPNLFGQCVKAAVLGMSSVTSERVRAEMKEDHGNRGGWLVSTEIASEVIDLARARSVMMQAGAQTMIMNSPHLFMASIVEDPTFSVHRELEEIPESDVKFGGIEFKAHTIATRITCSRELIDDAPNFASMMEMVLAESLAKQIDSYGLVGGANLHPMGLLQDPDIDETAGVGSIEWSDILAEALKIREDNIEPNAIIMAPSIHDKLFNLETGAGVTAARGWLDAPPTIRDKQFLHTTAMPTANVVIGDFTNAIFGIRQGVLIEFTTEGGGMFEKHGFQIKITWRGDFNTQRRAAFRRLAGVTV